MHFTLHSILLTIHIIAGFLGLALGTVNIIGKKYGKRHKQVGIVFTCAMLISSVSAIGLALINPNPFLLIIGVFTIYMVSTGYRYIRLRMSGAERKAKLLDWGLSSSMGLVAIYFLVMGGIAIFKSSYFGVVYLVFGVVGLIFVRADWKNYTGGSSIKNFWEPAHLQRMIGAYIASLTAFLVVNSSQFPGGLPGWLFWVLPTIIFTPLIIYWSDKYSKLKSK